MDPVGIIGIVMGVRDLVETIGENRRKWSSVCGTYTEITSALETLECTLECLGFELDEEQISQAAIIRRYRLRECIEACNDNVLKLRSHVDRFPEASLSSSKKRNARKIEENDGFGMLRDKLLNCLSPFKIILEELKWNEVHGSLVKPTLNDPWASKIVLCLDGGGIRGYATLIVLSTLVEEIYAEERRLDPTVQDSYSSPLFQCADDGSAGQNDPRYLKLNEAADKFRLCHYFDYICGTGTGGIAALMLGTMRCTIGETIRTNHQIWSEVTTGHSRSLRTFSLKTPRTKNSKSARAQLKDMNATVGTSDLSCQTIVFVAETPSKGLTRPYAIRSYQLSDSEKQGWRRMNPSVDTTNIPIVDAACATFAEPKLFNKVGMASVPGSFRDGSLYWTNPAGDAYKEILRRHMSTTNRINSLLSIGAKAKHLSTAEPTYTHVRDEGDHFLQGLRGQGNFEYDRVICRTTTREKTDLIDMLNEIEAEVARLCEDATGTAQGQPTRDRHPNGLETIRQTMRRWAQFLVEARRRRCRTVRWETYAGLSVTSDEQFPMTNSLDRKACVERWHNGAAHIDGLVLSTASKGYDA